MISLLSSLLEDKWRYVLLTGVIFFLLCLGDDSLFSALPLIGLGASGCSSCGCSGCSGCACASSGCTGCTGCSCAPSTPFLRTWNGKEFVFENDFLFGKPRSHFLSYQEGLQAYENGYVKGDLYRIQNPIVLLNGKLSLQINEIEPEESFIDSVSLLHVQHSLDSVLYIDSRFKKPWIFKREAVKNQAGVSVKQVLDHNAETLPSELSTITFDKSAIKVNHAMETGDHITIEAVVENRDRSVFLLLGSYYRDWTLGEIFDIDHKDKIKNEISSVWSTEATLAGKLINSFPRVALLSLLLALVWVAGVIPSVSKEGRGMSHSSVVPDTQKLAVTYGVRTANADTPPPTSCSSSTGKSLRIEYLAGSEYKVVDIVEPRYYQTSTGLVEIPGEAIGPTGNVKLKITATKKHHVTAVSLFAPEKQESFEKETLQVTKAVQQRTGIDHAALLNKPRSKEYLHTIPLDTVDVEFESPKLNQKEGQEDVYILQAKGFYTPATMETQQKLGTGWTDRLDPEAREFLKEMYEVSKYHEKDRKPVLS